MVEHDVASQSAAMSDVFDHRRGDLDSLGRGIRHLDGQVGAVAAVAGRPVVLDLVSRAEAFACLLPRLAQGYALDALDSPESEPDGEAAEAFLRDALRAPRLETRTAGMGNGLAIGSPALLGSGLEHSGELIQLSAFPVDSGRSAGRVAPPSRRR
jgi:hypothetical protein